MSLMLASNGAVAIQACHGERPDGRVCELRPEPYDLRPDLRDPKEGEHQPLNFGFPT
ncbi:hypothetical protein B0T21DRAFT_376827 [Apiosordaria backusii]|uniref:Uncharacterized protein n=1 Tax=Apiosordaria backusii TaxID=314023 RepID=A0AA40DM31_9PEZI|nr:hypothetical protein B0T21DRAFT_376827 [Apiosordaria backusii]